MAGVGVGTHNISNVSSAELAQRVVKVKFLFHFLVRLQNKYIYTRPLPNTKALI